MIKKTIKSHGVWFHDSNLHESIGVEKALAVAPDDREGIVIDISSDGGQAITVLGFDDAKELALQILRLIFEKQQSYREADNGEE